MVRQLINSHFDPVIYEIIILCGNKNPGIHNEFVAGRICEPGPEGGGVRHILHVLLFSF